MHRPIMSTTTAGWDAPKKKLDKYTSGYKYKYASGHKYKYKYTSDHKYKYK